MHHANIKPQRVTTFIRRSLANSFQIRSQGSTVVVTILLTLEVYASYKHNKSRSLLTMISISIISLVKLINIFNKLNQNTLAGVNYWYHLHACRGYSKIVALLYLAFVNILMLLIDSIDRFLHSLNPALFVNK